MTAQATADQRRLVPGVRALLVCFAALTLLATNQLFVLAERTADGFAWTISPPLTAAFFGGGYAAGFVLVVMSLRRGVWATARVGYLTVLLFTVLALAATLLHLDRFHFEADALVPRAAAWLWLVVYVVVPVAMLALLPAQARAPGTARPRGRRLGVALRVALAVQAAVMVIVGAGLFVLDDSRALWPWALTELTARAVASWLLALGVGALLAVAEDDLERLRPAAVTYSVLGLMQIVALLRFRADVDWSRSAAWFYVFAVLSVLAVGLTGVVRGRAADSPVPAPPRRHARAGGRHR